MKKPARLLPCRCCGALSIGEYDGYEICHCCGWEDDPSQAAEPERGGGANKLSLNEARRGFAKSNPRPPDSGCR